MRHLFISALLIGLVSGCASVNLGPHRIDVQQGNALDQESIARLKPGLNRSQVRFLLGTPLILDPFRADRWDYVYVFYKAGKLTEQKRITLFFDGETLQRIEGDVPAEKPEAQPPAAPANPEQTNPAPKPEAVTSPAAVAPKPTDRAPLDTPAASTPRPAPSPAATTSIVPPLPSPKSAPPYVDPAASAGLSLRPETDIEQIKPDAMPAFSVPAPANAKSTPTPAGVKP